MNIGILKDDPRRERRIALTPASVHSLIGLGANVYIEKDAGCLAHFTNLKYEEVGANIVYTSDEVFGRSDLLLKIAPPTLEEIDRLHESQILMSAMHLPIAKKQLLDKLLEKSICAIAIELLENGNGGMPILQAMSEIAGQMSIQIASRYLESSNNGRGILLGGSTGVPPASVVILGAGTVGAAATRTALGVGAQVIVLDKSIERLRRIENLFNHRIITGIVNEYNIRRAINFADVLIGAVLIKGEKTPHLVSEDMVKTMKPGSVIIDVSIDQGGCIETSRPTTIENPIYITHDVIHYCVPNMAANVARTATYAMTNSLLPYISDIIEHGIDSTIGINSGLSKGIITYKGHCTHYSIAKRFEVEYSDINTLKI